MASETARPNGTSVIGRLSAMIEDRSNALVWVGLVIQDVAVSMKADFDRANKGFVALAPSAQRESPHRSMLSNTRPAHCCSLPAGAASGWLSQTRAVSTSERGSGSRRATEPSSSHDVRL